MRWKTNLQTTPLGKLCRRNGWTRAFPNSLYDDNGVPLTNPQHGAGIHYHNHDLHRQDATREIITFLNEHTWADGSRQLFAGTQSRLYMLHEDTGYWDTLLSGLGTFGSVWRSASLNDSITFANGYDAVYNLQNPNGSTPNPGNIPQTIPDLVALGVSAPRVIIEFNGFVFIMNMVQSGQRYLSRIRWCDLNDPLAWAVPVDPANPDTFAGMQDLDYGDEIIGAGVLIGALYIFTRRSIWRCTVAATTLGDPTTAPTFAFLRVYHEPENQTGCLAFPYTLVSTERDFLYMSRDAIYKWNPYMEAPERKESDGNDWLYRASGAIYTKIDTAMSGIYCNLPCAGFIPATREVWFSWPSGQNEVNNWTLAAQIDHRTCDVIDHGITAFRNFRSLPLLPALCNEEQATLFASGTDWCIKSYGGVFYREVASYNVDDPTEDLLLETTYTSFGYSSILRGQVPTGLSDREKAIRSVLLDDDVNPQDAPCIYRMRIGNSYNIRDPNDEDDECSVLWQSAGPDIDVACIDGKAISAMKLLNQRPNVGKTWNFYYEGRFLYFELSILNKDGTAAIGGDTCLERLDFDLMAKVKA